MKLSSTIRKCVQRLQAYVPGEQPKIRGLIKLNTNENPFPPSLKVLEAVRQAVDGRLRVYPCPRSELLRKRLARLHGCTSDHIVVGNGSDDLLALATRAFVEPDGVGRSKSRSRVQYFEPSYSLYPVLSDIQGAIRHPIPLNAQFDLPSVAQLKAESRWDFQAALTFITTPNAPSGKGYSTLALDAICSAQRSIVVLDEAYVDFASENAMALAFKHPHVLVTRTFSKAYSLCFQRIGYMVGHPELIEAIDKIRDSYNVNGLGQEAALATLNDLKVYRQRFLHIIREREDFSRRLTRVGFRVFPSSTNFVLVQPPFYPAEEWYHRLRDSRILVRWFSQNGLEKYLRITIGDTVQMNRTVQAIKKLLPPEEDVLSPAARRNTLADEF